MPKQREQPRMKAGAAAEAEAKRERLAAQLRANLARRKAQARQRTAADANPGETSAADDGAP